MPRGYTEGQAETKTHDQVNSRFPQFFANAPKNLLLSLDKNLQNKSTKKQKCNKLLKIINNILILILQAAYHRNVMNGKSKGKVI